MTVFIAGVLLGAAVSAFLYETNRAGAIKAALMGAGAAVAGFWDSLAGLF